MYHVAAVGGGSYCLLNILKEVDRRKYNPVVLLTHGGPLVDEVKKLGIEVLYLPSMKIVPYNESALSLRAINNARSILISFGRFRKILTDVKPAMVYINTMMLYPYLRIAKEEGCKTIIHIREHWPEKEHKVQRSIAIGHIRKYSDAIVAINSFSASMIEDKSHPVTIVYDWIDLTGRDRVVDLDKIFHEDCTNKKIYLYMGGLQPVKGPMEVINAFTKHVKDSDCRLLVLGVNLSILESGWRGKVKAVLKKIGYQTFGSKIVELIKKDNRIKCIPSVYEICDLYRKSYCILSYFSIPHANLALAESIIYGTINVAASTPESIEYSHNGELAFLYEFRNQEDFARKITDFEQKRESMLIKIKQNSCYVQEMFDRKTNAAKLDIIYNKVLS